MGHKMKNFSVKVGEVKGKEEVKQIVKKVKKYVKQCKSELEKKPDIKPVVIPEEKKDETPEGYEAIRPKLEIDKSFDEFFKNNIKTLKVAHLKNGKTKIAFEDKQGVKHTDHLQ